ncbi:MAG: PIG-L family deacetylase [Candidatus Hydrogenedentes bacterium]|nr:PIG-L family deacetylase [Candidatus Hydrogenedentota bacterium]
MNIVCLGAHPDDGEFYAGGTLIKWAQAGHSVLVVSLTNGDIGHYEQSGGTLARRRAEESRIASERGGYEHFAWDNHDGELTPTLDRRKEVVRLLRRRQADLVLTHRPYDYHPDHRYTSLLVQDAAFMVTVPHFCPDTPALRRNPVFAYMMDRFTRPVPFQPDVAVDIDDVMDQKWSLLDAMCSQVYEWLPWLEGELDAVPRGEEERKRWLRQNWREFFLWPAEAARASLEREYGAAAAKVRYAEMFEICEYGRRPSTEELRQLFPVTAEG